MEDRSQPLEVSRKFASTALAIFLLVAAGLLAKQVVSARIATKDACGFYLPLAGEVQRGNRGSWQHPMIPPAYPLCTGLLARLVDSGDQPLELSGRLISAASVLVIVVLVYLIAASLFGRRVAVAAAALTAVNRWMIYFGASVGPDMMYGALAAGAVLCLVRYAQKPSAAWALGAAAASGAAALTRAEGVLLPVICVSTILVVGAFSKKRRTVRCVVHAGLLVAVVAVIFSPRLAYMHKRTGYYVLDVRALQVLHGRGYKPDPTWWHMPIEAGRIELGKAPAGKTLAARLQEAGETLLMVIGPATWFFAGAWFFGKKNIPRRSTGQAIIATVIIAQVAVTAPIKMDRRYVAAVAGLAQIWGGLGLVVLAERMRGASGWAGRFGRSIRRQMVGLGLIMAAMACWSLLGSNAGLRHPQLRFLAKRIIRVAGEGRTVLADSPQVPYYAHGRYVVVAVRDSRTGTLEIGRILQICRDHEVDFIVAETGETWCRSLIEQAMPGGPAAESVVVQYRSDKKAKGRGKTSYLIDARRLAELLNVETSSSASTHRRSCSS